MLVINDRTGIVLLERLINCLFFLLLHISLLFPSSTKDPISKFEKALCIQLNYLDSLAKNHFEVVYINFHLIFI